MNSLGRKEVERIILSLKDVSLDYPFGESVAVYKSGGKMFALLSEGKEPLSLSLKCDPQLSLVLQEKYETVMPGYHLNKRHWITVLLTGQIPLSEIEGLITLSHNLVTEK